MSSIPQHLQARLYDALKAQGDWYVNDPYSPPSTSESPGTLESYLAGARAHVLKRLGRYSDEQVQADEEEYQLSAYWKGWDLVENIPLN